MNISIQSKGGTPIYEQIATQIKEALPRKKHMRSWKRRK